MKQQELAMEGDRGMLIWLGKNRLDQTDKKETKTDMQFSQPVQFIFDTPSEMPELPTSEDEVKDE